MQMVRICVCHEYADVRHMDMFSLCNFLSFPFRSDFWWNRIFFPDSGAQRPTQAISCGRFRFPGEMTPHILCLAFPSPPRMFHTIKRRFAYSVCVVNFRKLVIRQKSDHPETAAR